LAGENLASQQFTVQLLDDLQRRLAKRYQSGAASYIDVVRARLELGRGRRELAAAQHEQIAALSMLNLLLGRQSSQPLQLSDSLTSTPLTLPRDLEFRDVVLPESQNAVNAAVAAYQSRQLSLTDWLHTYRTARQASLEKSRAIFNYLTACTDLETIGEKLEQAE
jgi:outer membrane protein TolC